MNMKRFGYVVTVLGALGALGCGDGEDDKNSGPLEIVGEYDDQFGGEQLITADAWNGSSIQEYDNDANVVYTQFPADDEFSPNLFAKTLYTEPDAGSFHFCMVLFDAESLAAAKASDATANDSNPAETGCGGDFPWSLASPK